MNFKDNFKLRDIVAAIGSMFFEDKIVLRHNVEWHAIDADGNYVPGHDGSVHNLVTTAGKGLMASRLCANTVGAVSHFAIGSGNTAAAVGQTALVTETARVAVDSATPAAAVATFVATVAAGTGTGTVEEIGLLNASSTGILVARALTGTITKPAGLGLVFTWTITVG